MLKINMTGLSEKELEGVVAERCASFGTVRKLKVYLPQNGSVARAFALVDMETPEQAAKLAAAAGQLTIDNAVVIFLQQDLLSAPTLVQARKARNGSEYADTYPIRNL